MAKEDPIARCHCTSTIHSTPTFHKISLILIHDHIHLLSCSLFPLVGGLLVVELPEGDRVVGVPLAPPAARDRVVVVPLVQVTRELCKQKNGLRLPPLFYFLNILPPLPYES